MLITRNKERKIIHAKGATTVIDYEGDQFKLKRFENVDAIKKFNYEMRKDENRQNGFSRDRDLRWIGRIPMALFIQHYRQYPEARDPSGNYWAEFLKKDENEVFKTVPSIVGGGTKYI